MYLYFVDFKRNIMLNFVGLQVYVLIMSVHLIRDLLSDLNQHAIVDDFERYFLYYAIELTASAIMVFSRITDDLFVHLNRERTILHISIF
mmetsp:Transcript_13660/g.17285  ORF Transcript_13660/g.17285 Transcript_13660/m.17285 type:complete len:90 (+) Transcript_13660:169-438(+)